MPSPFSTIVVFVRGAWHWLTRPSEWWAGVISTVCIGTLLGAGFGYPMFWWLAGLGIPMFLERVRQAATGQVAALAGWGMATTASAWSLVWFWSVLPIDWLPVGGVFLQGVVVGVYWITAAAWLGVSGVVVGVGWWWLAKRYPGSWWWAVPTLWVVGEVSGSAVFAWATWQSGIGVAPHFSFGYVGYVLAQHEWLFHFSALAGVYGLSWLAVLLSYSLFYIAGTSRWRWAVAVVVMISGLQLIPVSRDPLSAGISVAVVETDFTGSYRREVAIDTMIDKAVAAADTAGAAYVVLSEDMRYITSRLDSPLLPLNLRQRWGTSSITIIDSGRVATGDDAVLRGVVYDNETADKWVADKQYLVPQGEFLPALYAGVLQRVGYGPVLQEIGREVNYVPGPQAVQTFAGNTPGILFCFESVTPWGVRRILSARDQTPVFVAHPISHAWFHTPTTLWRQLDTMLRVQARWNQVPIISAGNQAPSAVYYPNGVINRVPDTVLPVHDRVQVKLFTL